MYKSWVQTPIGYELYAQGQYEREYLAFMYGGVYDGWFFYIPFNSNTEILLKAGNLKEAKREVEQRIQRIMLEKRNEFIHYIKAVSNNIAWKQINPDTSELLVKSPEMEIITAARVEEDEWYGYKFNTLFDVSYTRHILLLHKDVQKMAIGSIKDYAYREIEICEMLVLMLDESELEITYV